MEIKLGDKFVVDRTFVEQRKEWNGGYTFFAVGDIIVVIALVNRGKAVVSCGRIITAEVPFEQLERLERNES